MAPGINLIEPQMAFAEPILEYVDENKIVPQNGFIIDDVGYDTNPEISAVNASKIPDNFNGNNGRWIAYKISSTSALITATYSYIGTYCGTRIGVEATISNFIFNNKVNTTSPVGQNSWENQHPSNPPAGYMPAICIPHKFTISWVTKAVDSALVSLRFFNEKTGETIKLSPDSAYLSIAWLDNDMGGYEGVVPGQNCTTVMCAENAYIRHGTLRSDDGVYKNAFWGTLNTSGPEYPSAVKDDIDGARRTGITMFFEGDAINYYIIDTVGMVWWTMNFSPLFIEQPNSPIKHYKVTK